MKDVSFLIIGLIFISGCIYLFLHKPVSKLLTIGDTTFKVELADTDAERVQGLSGRETLKEGAGMLFIFNMPAKHGIWMKDMRFSIDIAWIDKNKKVIWVEKAVSPETFPQVFYPPSDILYVLELAAGTFEKLGVDIGDSVFPM